MSMTVENAKIEKEEVEQCILDILREFEEKTGLEVGYMSFDREQQFGGGSILAGLTFDCALR